MRCDAMLCDEMRYALMMCDAILMSHSACAFDMFRHLLSFCTALYCTALHCTRCLLRATRLHVGQLTRARDCMVCNKNFFERVRELLTARLPVYQSIGLLVSGTAGQHEFSEDVWCQLILFFVRFVAFAIFTLLAALFAIASLCVESGSAGGPRPNLLSSTAFCFRFAILLHCTTLHCITLHCITLQLSTRISPAHLSCFLPA